MTRPGLLITRPRASAVGFAQGLDRALLDKVEVCISPLIKITPTGLRPELTGFDGAIFTSANGVDHAEDGQGRPAYCVGAQTARVATARGWDVQATCQTADALVAHINTHDPDRRLAHLAGVHRRGDVARRLSTPSRQVEVFAIYDQKTQTLSAEAMALLSGEVPVILPLFSPRTAAQFASEAQGARKLHIIAMSDAVAAEVSGTPCASVDVVPEPTLRHIRQSVELQLRRLWSA